MCPAGLGLDRGSEGNAVIEVTPGNMGPWAFSHDRHGLRRKINPFGLGGVKIASGFGNTGGPDDHDFYLTSNPEPATLLTLGLALGGMAGWAALRARLRG